MVTTTADKIRAQIKMHGKTQADIASQLGVLPTSLSRTINNPRITLADLNKLADIIGCDVADFFIDYNPTPSLTCPHCGMPINVHID